MSTRADLRRTRMKTLLAIATLGAAAYASCADHHYEQELGRVGGPVPEFDVVLPDTQPTVSDATEQVPFCEAFKVMRTCRCCHFGKQPPEGESIGPFPLLEYKDTQAIYFDKPIFVRMKVALETDFMPLVDPCDDGVCVIDPPANPLEPGCKQTLLTWLDQGALPTGGTKCDPDVSCPNATIGCNPRRPP